MAKHTLFLIHGIGHHEEIKWSDIIWNKLIECSQQYPHFKTVKKLEDYAEAVPIGYDKFFRQALGRWDKQAQSFSEFANLNKLANGDSLDWLTGISSADSGLISSHITDIIIYRFFKLESRQIRANVQLKIFEEINRKRNLDSDAEFSVMAHSMGTSVVHDALSEFGTAKQIGDDVNTFNTQNFRFNSIHMIANVSRLLESDFKAYDSVVRPGPNNTRNRYCKRMYSYNHELDPFTKPKPFDPGGWGNYFRLTNLRHYRGWNVHDWLHYIDNPKVHIPLLKSITNPRAITSKQISEAESAYPRFGKDLENLAIAKKNIAELHKLSQAIDEDKGLKENFETLCKIWENLKDMKELVGHTWTKLEGDIS